MFAGGSVIFLLVIAVLALALRRPGRGEASVRKWIIGGGILFPSTVLIALLAFGIVTGERLLPRAGPDVVEVAAEGRQWQWHFTQPGQRGQSIRTEGTLHIPAGRPVDVVLTTRDVIHAFWVPRLAGKMDAIPGHRNVLRIEAAAAGIYEGVCAEYCGIGHARHAFRVIALDPADWSRFQSGENM